MNTVEQAVAFAAKAHDGQKRKISGLPYILHPMEVAGIISSMTDDLEVIAAGLLHDTVEDCGVRLNELEAIFGKRVAELVASETEDKKRGRPESETWLERKSESLELLNNSGDIGVKMLWLADKLSNLRSFYESYRVMGVSFFECLNQKDPKMQYHYYSAIAGSVSELRDTRAYAEYVGLIEKIFLDGGK